MQGPRNGLTHAFTDGAARRTASPAQPSITGGFLISTWYRPSAPYRSSRWRRADTRRLVGLKLNGKACPKHEAPAADCEACTAPLARNTVKNIVATLRALLYQAVEDRLIPNNRAARLGKLFSLRHGLRQHVTVLEPEGVAQVLAAAAKCYLDHELALRALFCTGFGRARAPRSTLGGYRQGGGTSSTFAGRSHFAADASS